MITLFTGSPGAGKTSFLVDFLSKLEGDRPIFSDGLEGLTLPHTACDANNWHTELPDGAILVIDEAQRVWRPRGSAAKVPDSVAELETHRHRGIDIFLTTQSPRLIDSNVRALVGRHVHIRDTGILGRYWYEWPECNDSMQWKTCINKHRITLPKKAFALYKSSSLHTTPVRGIPRVLFVVIIAFIVLSLLIYSIYKIINRAQPAKLPTPQPTSINTTHSQQVSYRSGQIDDRTDFIPRVSNKPESAPAYDHLRIITAMPVVRAGACVGEVCRCYTDQGTDPGLSNAECRTFVTNPPFDPYRTQQAATQGGAGAASAGTPQPASHSPANPSKSENSTVSAVAGSSPVQL